jgi:hypothetical protein
LEKVRLGHDRQHERIADQRNLMGNRINIEPRGLSRVEAARYLGISPTKFDELREDGRVGPARKIDSRKVWDVRDLDAAFEALPLEHDEKPDEEWDVEV